MKLFKIKKKIFNNITLDFENNNICCLNGFIISDKIFLKKKNFIIFNLKKKEFLISKMYIRTFFSNLKTILTGISIGYKSILILKGKGLRIQLKIKDNINTIIYFKLGYSHKIFFNIPKNLWIYIFDRRRSLILFSFNYEFLRNLTLKIKNYYPLNLYKIRGFYESNEIIKLKKGNLD